MNKAVIVFAGALASSACLSDNSVCVQSLLKSTDICFTVYSTFKGWTGIGIGATVMDKAEIYVGYANSTGGTTLASLIGSGHQVTLNKNQHAMLLAPAEKPANSQAKFSFSFCRPIKVSDGQSLSETTEYIYAGSEDKVSTADIATADLPMHSNEGNFGKVNFLDVKSNGPTTTVTTSKESVLKTSSKFTMQDVINLHGAMLWIAWVLSPIVGIFIARYAKDSLNHNWYKLHMAIMGITTVVLGIAGVIFIFLYMTPPHFDSTHAIVGTAITALMFVQVILGFVSNHMFDPSRTSIPVVDKTHWWLGRLLTLAGIANCQLGFTLYNSLYTMSPYFVVAHCSVVGGAVVLFTVAEFKIGQVNHINHNLKEERDFYGTPKSDDRKPKYH